MAEITAAAVGGGILGLLIAALLDPQGQLTHLRAVATAAGVFGGIGLDRLLRG